MKRNSTYILLAFVFFFAFILPNFFQPNQSLIFIVEEAFGFVFLIVGFFVFKDLIQKLIIRLNQRSPWIKSIIKRVLVDIGLGFLFSIILTAVVMIIGWFFFEIYGEPTYYLEKELMVKKSHEERGQVFIIKDFSVMFYLPIIFGISTYLFLSLFFVEESYEFNELKRKEEIAKEQAEKEQAFLKISVLQKQLNPHFMFNTLNVLSGLMHEDLEKADKFILKLSEIYRYVTLQSEEILTTVSKELDFADAYIYLLKIRFENQLDISINVNESRLEWFIPSLTLELLIENAIKHNRLSTNHPLRIEIIVEGEKLIVKNDYLPRIDEVKPSKVGIKNLQERLTFLGTNKGVFEVQSEKFIAIIPLISPDL